MPSSSKTSNTSITSVSNINSKLFNTIITHQAHGVFLKIEKPIIQLPRVKIHCPEILIGVKALIAGPI